MLKSIRTIVFLLMGLSSLAGAEALVNGDFEEGEVGAAPTGWFLPPVLAKAGYQAALVEDDSQSGARAVVLSCDKFGQDSSVIFGNVMQTVGVGDVRGKRVKLSAWLRVEGDLAARGQMWLRVDRQSGAMGFFDNMGDRPVQSKEWQQVTIVGDVESDAAALQVGFMLVGGCGKLWIDDVHLDVLGESSAGDQQPAPLDERGLANLGAFARLLGAVRYFHPSDEVVNCDWDSFIIAAVRKVEPAANPDELAAVLRGVFASVAPTVSVYALGSPLTAERPETTVPVDRAPDGKVPTKVVAWTHHGLGGKKDSQSIYHSKRVRAEPTLKGSSFPELGTAATLTLGAGVACRVPLVLLYDSKGTVPTALVPALVAGDDRPAGWSASPEDRATRLAAVVTAWSALENFYPYFDVVATDWPAALNAALAAAATDQDGMAFLATLERLIAALHDGHGNVWNGKFTRQFGLPLLFAVVEGKLAVSAIAPDLEGRVRPGDVVLKIDGEPAADSLAREAARVSGATEGWIHQKAAGRLSQRATAAPVTLVLRSPDGKETEVKIAPVQGAQIPRESRPDKIAELQPGIFYVDIDRIDDADFAGAVDRLAKATGIIFDLRGYPGRLGTQVIAHLTSDEVRSAIWNVPVLTRPGREGMTFETSGWPVKPVAPKFEAKVAFVTAGGAISYAETYMGIIEHFHLAEIVGEPTAGTNGNVNSVALPGGYTMIFTGMQVLKHDGSQHHGVGIKPTVPVSRTLAGLAAGRDEMLEGAVKVVSKKRQ